MKSKPFIVVAFALVIAACSADEGSPDPVSNGSVTTVTTEQTDTSNDGTTEDTAATEESTAVLQSGSSTSLGPSITVQTFESDPDAVYAIPFEDIPPGQNPAYYTPFTVDQGSVRVVWDRWWWGLLDGLGSVTVTNDGSTVAEGNISGEGAVQVQDPSTGSISIYGPNGDVVATVTQEDLTEAIREAQAEANIG